MATTRQNIVSGIAWILSQVGHDVHCSPSQAEIKKKFILKCNKMEIAKLRKF